jgi:nucleotide-binding universal stress UspA family protein
MLSLRTVLCPIDFSPATDRQVRLAADLCRAFDAKLVLHHNVSELAAGAAVGWMWAADHHATSSESTIETRLRAWLETAAPVRASEARLTHGQAAQAVVNVSDAVEADLVVLSTHGANRDDHASITQQVLEHTRRAVLALHEPEVEHRQPSFGQSAPGRQVVLVPTDLTPESHAAIALAFDLARRFPMEPHLLHLVPGGREARSGELDAARQQMMTLVPDEFVGRARVHVEHDDAARGIARLAERLDAACIVMGEHTRAPIRRWFSRDTSSAVLHRAPCPVWYVPGGRTA